MPMAIQQMRASSRRSREHASITGSNLLSISSHTRAGRRRQSDWILGIYCSGIACLCGGVMSVTVFWWTRTRARANKQTHTLTSVRATRRYGNHSALYRMQQDGQRLQDGKPVFYVYDSYHTSPAEWSTVLGRHGAKSIRGGKYDCIVLGLWVEAHHGEDLRAGGFDGM